MTTKERLHQLIDGFSEKEAAATLHLIDSRDFDPLLRAIAEAPDNDEPFTEDDEAAIAEVEADRATGMTAIPFEEVKRRWEDIESGLGRLAGHEHKWDADPAAWVRAQRHDPRRCG
jgi:hypothetical protein